MPPFKKVKTDSLRAQVYAQLKAQLLKGAWAPGQKLPSENQLCATFGVSRVTVRAALQQLEILGLVETKHGGGTFAKDHSALQSMELIHSRVSVRENQELITVLEYRKIVEKGTIALAVKRAGPEDIASLEETYAAMLSVVDRPDAFAEADLEFHLKIARITRNPILVKVCSLINDILREAMVDIVRLLGHQQGVKYHRLLIDAMAAGNAAECERLMGEHIEVTVQGILEAGDAGKNPLAPRG